MRVPREYPRLPQFGAVPLPLAGWAQAMAADRSRRYVDYSYPYVDYSYPYVDYSYPYVDYSYPLCGLFVLLGHAGVGTTYYAALSLAQEAMP